MFLAPTMRSEKLIAESLKAYPEKANKYDDQGAINSVISSNSSGASVGLLDPAAYPNGHRFFSMRSQCKATPSLIHQEREGVASSKATQHRACAAHRCTQ